MYPCFHYDLVYLDKPGILLSESHLEIFISRLQVAVEDEIEHPQCEHVLAALSRFVVDPGVLQAFLGEGGDRCLDKVIPFKTVVGQRIDLVTGFLYGFFFERVGVDNDGGPFLGPLQVGPEGGGVHGDEHIHLVTDGVDLFTAQVDLEAGNTRDRVLRSTDLGGEIGEGRKVVACNGSAVGEYTPGQLHAVAGVAYELHHHAFPFNNGSFFLGHERLIFRDAKLPFLWE